MPEVVIATPSDHPDWNNLLAPEAGYSFFHTREWSDTLARSYGYQPFYFTAREQETLSGLLAVMEVRSLITGVRGVSLPFTDTCDPVAPDTNTFNTLMDRAVLLGKERGWKYIELRGGQNFLPEQPFFAEHIGHRLNLTSDVNAVNAGLRDSTRRNIKKAVKERVEVHISNEPVAMATFRRLNTKTRRKHGLPPQPVGFFKNLHDRVIAANLGFIAVATLGDKPLAANVYLHFGHEVIYKYGASDPDTQSARANNLLMWEAIRWSCDRGFQSMHFGRTERQHAGLLQFKAGWGTTPYTLKYYRYDLQKNAFIGSIETHPPAYHRIFQKLPEPLLTLIGKVAYRHMG